MRDDLLEFLMSDAEAACEGDKDKMALYLAGVAVGVIDSSWSAISRGFIRMDPGLDQIPKAVPQPVLTTNEILEGMDNGD